MEKTLGNVFGANVQNWVVYLQFLTDCTQPHCLFSSLVASFLKNTLNLINNSHTNWLVCLPNLHRRMVELKQLKASQMRLLKLFEWLNISLTDIYIGFETCI